MYDNRPPQVRLEVVAVLAGLVLAIALLGMVLISKARAEDAPQQPAATEAPQPPQKFYFELDAADLQSISQALNELPKRLADPLILKLQGQLQAQAQAKIVENRDVAIKGNKGIVTKDQRGDNKISK